MADKKEKTEKKTLPESEKFFQKAKNYFIAINPLINNFYGRNNIILNSESNPRIRVSEIKGKIPFETLKHDFLAHYIYLEGPEVSDEYDPQKDKTGKFIKEYKPLEIHVNAYKKAILSEYGNIFGLLLDHNTDMNEFVTYLEKANLDREQLEYLKTRIEELRIGVSDDWRALLEAKLNVINNKL